MIQVTKRHLARLMGAFILVLLGLAICTVTVSGHAAFESSDPSPDAILATPPADVTIRFTEPLEPSQSSAELLDPTGAVIEQAISFVDQSDPYVMHLTIPTELGAGTYVVSWRNFSTADGHPMEGYFAFSVQSETEQSTAIATLDEKPGGPPGWWISVVKWIAYLGLALVVAGWPL